MSTKRLDSTSPGGSFPADLIEGAAQVLDAVDSLPRDVAGVLSFGNDGLILVEDGKICWAVARDMPNTLTDLLCAEHKTSALSRIELERVYKRCRSEHRPLGATLVESGLVSAGEVRSAFGMHHAGAIAQLARGSRKATNFEHAAKSRDDRRFSFGTAEALVALAPPDMAQQVARARLTLAELELRDTSTCAFVRPSAGASPVVLAVNSHCELGASHVRDLSRWAVEMLALAATVDPSVHFVSGIWAGHASVVAFRDPFAYYAAVCKSRPASALLTSAVTRRLADSGTSGAWPPLGRQP